MNDFMNKFWTFEKKAIHAAAVVLVAGAGWWVTHPEQVVALVKTYPRLSIVGTFATLIMTLYAQIKPGVPPTQ